MCTKFFYSDLNLFLKCIENKTIPFIHEVEQETFILKNKDSTFILLRKADFLDLLSFYKTHNQINCFFYELSKLSLNSESFYRIVYDDDRDIQAWQNLNFKGIAIGMRDVFLFNNRIISENCHEVNLSYLNGFIQNNKDKDNFTDLFIAHIQNESNVVLDSESRIFYQQPIIKINFETSNFETIQDQNHIFHLYWESKNINSELLLRYYNFCQFVIGADVFTSPDDLSRILSFYGIHIDNDEKNTIIYKLDFNNKQLSYI